MMNRYQTIQYQIAELGIDGLMISAPENRRYLSEFTGSSGNLLLDGQQAFLATDFRYWEQAEREAPEFKLVKTGPKFWASVAEFIRGLKWQRIGFEAHIVTYEDYRFLTELLPECQWIPIANLVEKQRAIKDETEIETIAQAARITDLALAKALKVLKPGVTENDVALEFDYQLRRHGAEDRSFATIVASGWRGALPHGAPTAKKIVSGDLVVIDGGALYQGYHADLTRTVVVGQATQRQREIYDIVLQAQRLALSFLQTGRIGNAVDGVARKYITDQGFKENFGHGLGHSVGLNIHENPRLSPTESGVIPRDAVITVEPGIYLPEWGGIRIEDLVVVGDSGVRNLTGSPKNELIEI